MITSLSTSLSRVTLFWYVVGAIVLFVGDPAWAEALYQRLMVYPWVPVLEMHGLGTAAAVQWRLLLYWTVPMGLIWASSLGLGVLLAELQCQWGLHRQRQNLKPTGEFWGVVVPHFSLGKLPQATTPQLAGQAVSLGTVGSKKNSARVEVQGAIKEAVKMLTPAERQLAEELLQMLLQAPHHYAGAGHGVGLLEHTLNVVTEAAAKVTPEFRMPLLAALSHDIGKLITFQPDGNGGWVRKGLHSRESARILATLPAFQELPELHQRALLLAVKYDHAPNKMPELRGERDASTLALRTISALSHADRKATADEKERHLERLQPEDLLWKDFVDFLREAPVVQRGKKGAANQVNNPPDSPYIFVYEAPWRDAAVRRLPAEVAAALDLTRRDAGKMAKYTRILVERLRKEGLLVEKAMGQDPEGAAVEYETSDVNPLWDIQSGTGEKAVALRGILVLKADDLWKKLNYRISVKSPFPVQILRPNADLAGKVNDAPRVNRDEPHGPDVSDGLKVADVSSHDAMASLGLSDDQTKTSKPRTRARGDFRTAPASNPAQDAMLGLTDSMRPAKPKPAEPSPPAPETSPGSEPKQTPADQAEVLDQEAQEIAELEAATAGASALEPVPESSVAMDNALAYLNLAMPASEQEPEAAAAVDIEMTEPNTAPSNEAQVVEPSASVEKPQQEKLVQVRKPETPQAPKKPKETEPRAEPVVPVAKAAPDTSTSKHVAGEGDELSRAERREGLAIADAAAVAQYPGLQLGDKYYTEHSRAVQSGLKKPGSRYKGDRDKGLDLTDGGPRRGRRRLTS